MQAEKDGLKQAEKFRALINKFHWNQHDLSCLACTSWDSSSWSNELLTMCLELG